jgi:hypothetical protein
LYTIYKDAKGIEFDLGEHISSRKKLKKKPEKRGHTLLQPEKENAGCPRTRQVRRSGPGGGRTSEYFCRRLELCVNSASLMLMQEGCLNPKP